MPDFSIVSYKTFIVVNGGGGGGGGVTRDADGGCDADVVALTLRR